MGVPMLRAKKKYFLPFSLLLCLAAATAMGFGYHVKSQDQEQVEFITSFYKNYLSLPEMKRAYYVVPPGSFYSIGVEELIGANANLCGTLSRSDDICGYGADGDVFLNAQEIDPKLTFAKSDFKASIGGKNMVDVSFNVYPKYGADYDRKIRYVLLKEKVGWRVDNVLFGEGERFSVRDSLRNEINTENERVLQQASEIYEAASWVFSYLREADMLDRAERFLAYPVKVCSEGGNCQVLQKDDVRLRQAMLVLHRAYFKGDSDNTTVLNGYWPKPGQVRAEEGKIIRVDALDFTFHRRAWWITKIDLRSLGRAIPVQRSKKT